MKLSGIVKGRLFLLLNAVFVAAMLVGCKSPNYSDPGFVDIPVPTGEAAQTNAPNATPSGPRSSLLRPGYLISISFQGVPEALAPFEGRIKDDGTITLLYNQSFVASGKTVGELERDIRAAYVPKYFVNMTTTVKVADLYYSVDGQVKSPSRQVHLGPTTVLGAIASVGGYTEFANKKKIEVTRSNKEVIKVNGVEAQKNPEKDIEIYPGDQIYVHKRIF